MCTSAAARRVPSRATHHERKPHGVLLRHALRGRGVLRRRGGGGGGTTDCPGPCGGPHVCRSPTATPQLARAVGRLVHQSECPSFPVCRRRRPRSTERGAAPAVRAQPTLMDRQLPTYTVTAACKMMDTENGMYTPVSGRKVISTSNKCALGAGGRAPVCQAKPPAPAMGARAGEPRSAGRLRSAGTWQAGGCGCRKHVVRSATGAMRSKQPGGSLQSPCSRRGNAGRVGRRQAGTARSRSHEGATSSSHHTHDGRALQQHRQPNPLSPRGAGTTLGGGPRAAAGGPGTQPAAAQPRPATLGREQRGALSPSRRRRRRRRHGMQFLILGRPSLYVGWCPSYRSRKLQQLVQVQKACPPCAQAQRAVARPGRGQAGRRTAHARAHTQSNTRTHPTTPRPDNRGAGAAAPMQRRCSVGLQGARGSMSCDHRLAPGAQVLPSSSHACPPLSSSSAQC